jgi:hypothetical protein
VRDIGLPMELGVIFIGADKRYIKSWKSLNFDRHACSYLLLQLNVIQTLFQFNIIKRYGEDILPPKEDLEKDQIIDWFDDLVDRISKREKLDNICGWIGITSRNLPGSLFALSRFRDDPKSKSQRNVTLITTDVWEKSFSPPSVFEYVIFVIFKNAIFFLSNNFGHDLSPEETLTNHAWSITRGCIYDGSLFKANRRFGISTPNLCMDCIDRIKKLDQSINKNTKVHIPVYEGISKVLNKDWMGKPDERGTPLFNLKKDYKYDIDRNSGLYKSFFEKFRDSTVDNLPQWIVGTLISGVIGGLLIVFGLNK